MNSDLIRKLPLISFCYNLNFLNSASCSTHSFPQFIRKFLFQEVPGLMIPFLIYEISVNIFFSYVRILWCVVFGLAIHAPIEFIVSCKYSTKYTIISFYENTFFGGKYHIIIKNFSTISPSLKFEVFSFKSIEMRISQ